MTRRTRATTRAAMKAAQVPEHPGATNPEPEQDTTANSNPEPEQTDQPGLGAVVAGAAAEPELADQQPPLPPPAADPESDTDTEESIQELIARVRRHNRSHDIAFGDALYDLRQKVQKLNMSWAETLEKEFDMKAHEANRRIHAAQLAHAYDLPDWIPYCTVEAIGAAPKDVCESLVRRLRDGERITRQHVREAIKKNAKPKTREVQHLLGIPDGEPNGPAMRRAAEWCGNHLGAYFLDGAAPAALRDVESVLADPRLHESFGTHLIAALHATLHGDDAPEPEPDDESDPAATMPPGCPPIPDESDDTEPPAPPAAATVH